MVGQAGHHPWLLRSHAVMWKALERDCGVLDTFSWSAEFGCSDVSWRITQLTLTYFLTMFMTELNSPFTSVEVFPFQFPGISHWPLLYPGTCSWLITRMPSISCQFWRIWPRILKHLKLHSIKYLNSKSNFQKHQNLYLKNLNFVFMCRWRLVTGTAYPWLVVR